MTTTDATPVRKPDLDRAVEALEAVDEPAALAALARDVLGTQAEGRTRLAGAKLAQTKAEEHGVEHEAAETPAGNLRAVLERGAKTPLKRALVAAFAVRGLEDALDEAEDPQSLVFRFVRHADWLEIGGDHAVYPLVDRVLSEENAARVWKELAQRVVDDAAGRDGGRADVRARNAARLTALANATSDAAAEALREVVGTSTLDEPTRLLARTLAGDDSGEAAVVSPSIAGRLGPAPKRGALKVVRWLTGWAVLAWLVRGVGSLLGLRSEAELKLSGGRLEVKTHVSFFGRTVREGEESWTLDSLDGASRRVRYPSIHLLVGAIALSAGVLFGSLVLFDGVRSGELILVLLASVLVLAGAALDLVLDVLLPARGGHVVMDLASRSRAPLRLTRVPVEQADAFLKALRNATARTR